MIQTLGITLGFMLLGFKASAWKGLMHEGSDGDRVLSLNHTTTHKPECLSPTNNLESQSNKAKRITPIDLDWQEHKRLHAFKENTKDY